MAKKLTKKEKGFIKDYIETGNATESAARNYNVKDRSVARSVGCENLTKPHIIEKVKSIADYIPDDLLIKVQIEGLGASRTIIKNEDEILEPDYAVRHKYLDTALKIKGTYAPEKIKHSGEIRFGELENLTNEELAQLADTSTE